MERLLTNLANGRQVLIQGFGLLRSFNCFSVMGQPPHRRLPGRTALQNLCNIEWHMKCLW